MPRELVAHPETGQPSFVETNYLPVERQALQDKVDADQAAFDAAAAALQQAQEAHTNAQVALEDSKSILSRYDEIAPNPGAEAGAEESGSEAETPTEEAAEPAESDAVAVPVSVEAPSPADF